MSYEWLMGNAGTYMNMQALGLYNNMLPMGYLGSGLSYGIPFSSVLSGALAETLSKNGLSAQDIVGMKTVTPNSDLQKELSKLGYGNAVILVPGNSGKQAEENTENAQKLGKSYQKWKANYDTANGGRKQVSGGTGTQTAVITGRTHKCSLRNCAFGSKE